MLSSILPSQPSPSLHHSSRFQSRWEHPRLHTVSRKAQRLTPRPLLLAEKCVNATLLPVCLCACGACGGGADVASFLWIGWMQWGPHSEDHLLPDRAVPEGAHRAQEDAMGGESAIATACFQELPGASRSCCLFPNSRALRHPLLNAATPARSHIVSEFPRFLTYIHFLSFSKFSNSRILESSNPRILVRWVAGSWVASVNSLQRPKYVL